MQPMYRGYGTPERTGSLSLPTNCGAAAITPDSCEVGRLLARIEPSRTVSSRSEPVPSEQGGDTGLGLAKSSRAARKW